MSKARELRDQGLTDRQIGEELHLSVPTINWLLTREVGAAEGPPEDIRIGWRSLGIFGKRLDLVAQILTDIIEEENEKTGVKAEVIVGVALNGIPLATLVAAQMDLELNIYRTSTDPDKAGTFSSNFATTKGKKAVLVDDVISSGATAQQAIADVRAAGGEPILMIVLVNKTNRDALDGVSVRGLIRTVVVS